MLTFLGGVCYGVVLVVVFALFLILTLMTYLELVDDFCAIKNMDSSDALWKMISRLGRCRVVCAVIVAFLWPVSITLYWVHQCVYSRVEHLEEMPIFLWVFLGFGKFKPKEKEQATT
jgi:hypothetical protein